MSVFTRLKQTGSKWEFESEAALEDFVWVNLENLLSFTPLNRQYCVNGQYCDILAVDQNQQLVILELKNIEDRYIIQQLTRYYDALLEEKPFSEAIDYNKPVRLLAIQPSFHRDNFTDIKYHRLDFNFFQFSVIQQEEKLYFQLTDLQTENLFKIQIPYQEKQFPQNIPSPPRKLLNLLEKYPESDREGILQLRTKLLSFDERMQEITESGSIKYGSKNQKFCVEFYIDHKKDLFLFFWLPLKRGRSQKIGRFRIWTDWSGKALGEGYVASGVGKEINNRKRVIAARIIKYQNYMNEPGWWSEKERFMRQAQKDIDTINRKISELGSVTYEEFKYFEAFLKSQNTQLIIPYESMDLLVDLVLEKWIERI